MKPLVLFSVLFAGAIYHSAHAAQPEYKRPATSSQTSTVSIVKTDSIKFVGQSNIVLQQKIEGTSPATGFTSICITSLSNRSTITLSTNNDKQFILTNDNSGSPIPYNAQLQAAPLSDKTACKHGQYFQLNLSIPETIYNTATSGIYTDTLTITIAAE